ncbi:MAG: ATPase [Bryobacterales bacterium]|nr:ATPase [Bryobacterales bacterium]
MPRYFLGVDGGQSSTTAVAGDETGRVIGYGRGGPCNHVKGPGGREKFIDAIGGCVGQALESAGLPRDTAFESGCLGFSGGPADKEQLLSGILKIEKRTVTNDALIALSGAHAGGPGVITIAGTGSISLARNAQGKTVRTGGWGFIFGDEGGAFDVTRQALRAILRMDEGWGPPTALRTALLEATGASSANDLLHRFYTTDFPRPRVAAFARLVDVAAEAGDRVADGILDAAAQQLASITAAARRQAFGADEKASIAPIGGVFRSARIRERFKALVELVEHNQVVEPAYGPAAGALLDAYRAAGLSVVLSDVPVEK